MQNYENLVAKVKSYVEEITQRHPDDFKCTAGCFECCVGGINLWRVEFDHIQKIVKERGLRATNAKPGMCPYLDSGGHCVIYEARPLVCMLWGAPALSKDGRITCCAKNFTQKGALEGLGKNDIVNLDTVLTTLAAINHVYCKNTGCDPEERIELK